MKFSYNNRLVLLFIIVIIGIVFSVVITENNKDAMRESTKRIEHTHEVFDKSSHIESSIQYILLSNQGYRMSGIPLFLEKTKLEYEEIQMHLEELALLVNDNYKQVANVKLLNRIVAGRIEFLHEGKDLAERIAADPNYKQTSFSEKKVYLDQVKEAIAMIQSEEIGLLTIRQNNYSKSSEKFYFSFYLLLGFVLALIILMFFLLMYSLKEKDKIKDVLVVKNEWYNQLMSSLGWGVISVDVDGVITFINRVAEELSGSKGEELIGEVLEDVFDVSNEGDESRVMKPLADVMLGNKVTWLGNDAVLKGKDGSKTYIDGSGAPIYSYSKSMIGSVLVFRDISKDKKVQLELLRSSKEIKDYKYALDESAMVATTDQKGRITYVNDKFCEISKYSRADLIGQDHRIINSGCHSKEFIRELWATVANGKIWKGEIKNRKKDGVLYWVDTTIVPFLDDKGKPYQYVAIRSDITEKKNAEENFLTLANNISQHAWTADADGMIFWYNQRWFDYSGTTEEEIHSFELGQFIHPDHLQRAVETRIQSIESGEPWGDMYLLRGSDGSYRWFLVRVVPISDDQGKVIRWFGTNTDTTVIKEAEEKLIAYQGELELKVEQLNKTNSELDRFVYSTSHDLRAPLKSMLGLIGIVKRGEDPSNIDQVARLDMLNESVLKLDDFIEDILNYSRNSRMGVVCEEINFEELIEEIRNNHKFMEGANEVKAVVQIHQNEKFIADKGRIKVILNNLVSNAIKYKDVSKEESFVSIFVECDIEKTTVTIEDNGIGIAEDKHEKVYDMFYRATTISTGSGIGMYIVKETVEKIGGTVTLESKLNVGTKVSIQIPNQNN